MNFCELFAAKDQSPAFELITADRAKAFDGMLAVFMRKLV